LKDYFQSAGDITYTNTHTTALVRVKESSSLRPREVSTMPWITRMNLNWTVGDFVSQRSEREDLAQDLIAAPVLAQGLAQGSWLVLIIDNDNFRKPNTICHAALSIKKLYIFREIKMIFLLFFRI
jgi:hypothetical protein